MQSPSVAVCIVTRNRAASLGVCLECIERQTHPATEIIVVDNSTDSLTRDFLNRRHPGVKYFHSDAPIGSQPTLRNVALANATSDILAITDDDGYPRPEWIAELLAAYEEGVGAVGGRILQGPVVEGTGGTHPLVGTLSPVKGECGSFNVAWPEPFEVDHLQGTNLSIRRGILVQAGGWDCALEGGYAPYEDTEICLRVKRLGYSVVYAPHAIVQHGLEPRDGGFTRNLGLSPALAYSVARNVVYTVLKSYRATPSVVFGAGVIAPVVNIGRIFFPRGASAGRHFSPTSTRMRAAAAVISGHIAGLGCLLRNRFYRETDTFPRL